MEIIWREVALNGLENARRYIAEHNPSAADRIFEAILSSVKRLADGKGAINLAAAKLMHMAGSRSSTKRYLNMKPLKQRGITQQLA